MQADSLRDGYTLRGRHGDHAKQSSDSQEKGKRGARSRTSAALENPSVTYPYSADPLVQALQRLLEMHGGRSRAAHMTVGEKANINDQSLYQIVECKINTKTGKPNGVGPSIRKRLDAAFPRWLASSQEHPAAGMRAAEALAAYNVPSIDAALDTVLEALRNVPPLSHPELLDRLRIWIQYGGASDKQRLVELLRGGQPLGKQFRTGTR